MRQNTVQDITVHGGLMGCHPDRFFRLDNCHAQVGEQSSSLVPDVTVAGSKVALGNDRPQWSNIGTGQKLPGASGARGEPGKNVTADVRREPVVQPTHGFEHVVAEWLCTHPRQQQQLLALARLLATSALDEPGGVLFISLAEETDVSRLLMALAWLMHHETSVVLADADVERACLTHLCGKQHVPGWAEVCQGWISLKDALQQLAIPGVSLLPAGRAAGHSVVDTVEWAGTDCQALRQQISQFASRRTIWCWDGGTWPHCAGGVLWRLARRVIAVVRLNQSRWCDVEQFHMALHNMGKSIDGCVVFSEG